MPARVAFRRMLPRAGFVASSAAIGISASYSSDRAFDYMMGPTKPRSKRSPSMKAIEPTAPIMLYRHFKPSWQTMCAICVYRCYSGFCQGFCTAIFNGCKRVWDEIKIDNEAALALDSEDNFVEDTT
ncbi:uncharacterized protein EAF02_010334 [Botrytis sinoallii]|uniref:uncharacterized protein n=1 Tax=Botrytis sinoallii TaxID=1463999 RepID=UPI0019026D2D|nr:uncharacterized protein EAF02_010334 [Botrytis sinoallii]KAF7862785.1 hypothetical protein EAF02_010334 [Botrytis sinoallii]